MLTFDSYYPNPTLSKSEAADILHESRHHRAVVLVSDITNVRYRITSRLDTSTGEILYSINDEEFSFGEAVQQLQSVL